MLWKCGSTIYRLSHRATLSRMGIIFKSVWQNSDGLRLRSQSRRSGPLCAHTRLSRGDEFRATFVAPSCYFRPSSGMCVCMQETFRGGPPGGSASPTQQWPCVAWRLRCVCHVRPILTVSPPSITAYPLSIHPGDRALSPACMAWSFLPLHRRVKSWVQIEKCPSDFRFRCYSSCEK